MSYQKVFVTHLVCWIYQGQQSSSVTQDSSQQQDICQCGQSEVSFRKYSIKPVTKFYYKIKLPEIHIPS